jgi:hypothetical protein
MKNSIIPVVMLLIYLASFTSCYEAPNGNRYFSKQQYREYQFDSLAVASQRLYVYELKQELNTLDQIQCMNSEKLRITREAMNSKEVDLEAYLNKMRELDSMILDLSLKK